MAGSDSKATWEVELKDSTSDAADDASSALERLKDRIQADSAALKQLQAAMANLQKGSSVNIETHKALQARIDSTKESLGKAQGQFLNLGGNLADLSKKTKVAKEETVSLGQAFESAGGPIGEISSKASGLLELISSPAGLVAAILAAGLALAGGVIALVGFGVACADAARSARLLIENQAGGAKNGEAMTKWVNKLAHDTPLATEQLRAMVGSLTDKGLQGNALAASLEATAIATSALGQSAGSKIEAIAASAVRTRRLIIGMFDLQGTGITIDEVAQQLAKSMKMGVAEAKAALQNGRVDITAGAQAMRDALKAKFGDQVAKEALSLPNQFEKAKENLGKLFSDLNIDPLLQSLHDILGLLDQNTDSGKALHKIMTTMIQPLIDQAVKAGPIIKDVFRGMIIGALMAAIVFYQFKIALKKAIPPEFRPNVDAANSAVMVGVIFFGMLAGAAFALLGALAIVVAAGMLPFIVTAALVSAASDVVSGAFDAVKSAVDDAGTYLKNLDWSDIGFDLIKGFASGITSAGRLPVTAITSIGSGAISALRNAIDSHSPSKKAFKAGVTVPQGFAGGIEDGTDDVESAAAGMISIPTSAAAEGHEAASGMGAAAMGGARFGDVKIEINGVRDADHLRSEGVIGIVEEAFRRALMGSGVSPVVATVS